MIAGIYGMNFEHMPELGWTYGYPIVVAVMLVVCLGLFRLFKKSGGCSRVVPVQVGAIVPVAKRPIRIAPSTTR